MFLKNANHSLGIVVHGGEFLPCIKGVCSLCLKRFTMSRVINVYDHWWGPTHMWILCIIESLCCSCRSPRAQTLHAPPEHGNAGCGKPPPKRGFLFFISKNCKVRCEPQHVLRFQVFTLMSIVKYLPRSGKNTLHVYLMSTWNLREYD